MIYSEDWKRWYKWIENEIILYGVVIKLKRKLKIIKYLLQKLKKKK
nr:MAG TPA: hypothetical protein [Caudoviricetes sp.]